MNKELKATEALEKINTMFLAYAPRDIREDKEINEDLFECIKSTIKRLEEIDEWKTSYQIPNDEELRRYIHNGWWFETKGQQQINAFEIIKNKHINIGLFLVYFGHATYEDYLTASFDYRCAVSDTALTKEEYELLREVLL